jgi:hypothetical protein
MVKAKLARATPYEAPQALQFRRNAASFLQAAKQEMAPVAAYTLAYEGVHALAVGFLYLHGLSPQGDGHRTVAIGTLMDHLKDSLDIDDRSDIEKAIKVRNNTLYRAPAPPVSARAASDLLASVQRLEGLLKTLVPNWYAMKG